MNQMLSMILNAAMRAVMKMDWSRGGAKPQERGAVPVSQADRERAAAARQSSQRAKQMIKLLRRMGR